MTNPVWTEIKIAAQEAPRMYFAPLVGAIKGIQQQYRKLNQPCPAPAARDTAPGGYSVSKR